MTYTYEKLANFCGNSVNSMNHYIDYIKEKDCLDVDVKRDWALSFIKDLKEQTFGALVFSKVYSREIDEETFDKLMAFVNSGHDAAEDRIWREI